MKSQDSEKKKEGGLGKVYISEYSLTTGELKRRKVNFSSMARLEAVNQAIIKLFKKTGGCYDGVLRKGK